MHINLYILGASGRLDTLENDIREAFDGGLVLVKERINLPDIDVVVADNPSGAIAGTGIGGFAQTAHVLSISIDPEEESLRGTLKDRFRSTLAHELHHCARWASVGYGDTLLEAVVSEGLADHFDIEVNGGEPKPWSTAVRGEELERVRNAAEAVRDQAYKESEWFFGAGDLPRWAGYSLGFTLVREYMEETGKSASELVDEKAGSFLS